ncbi:hypothetical protein Tco_1106680, partial [Tanacetum coccineum]
ASSKKRPRAEPDEESVKRQKIRETLGSGKEQSPKKEKELSEELQKLLVVVPVEEVYVEALQVKYPIIDWVVYYEDTRRDGLVKLWDLVKKRFSTIEPTDDKEKEYPLTKGTLGLMMVARLLVEAYSEMSRELLIKIFYQANIPRHMRMEQYLTFTDHALWEVIVNGDSVSPIASASVGAEAIPDEHLLKFHACKDAKSLWEAIKNRFEGNKESKKMQKTILKQNYVNFAASSQEGMDKTYDRFQKLISQLEIHGEVISQEDANLKLLRSLPSTWNNIALIMRNKTDLDTLSMDDLYNNLKVSTNETVNIAHSVSAASSKDQASTASYADDQKASTSQVHQVYHVQSLRYILCSKNFKSYEAHQKHYIQQREALNKSNLEIIGYQMGLESLEAMIVVDEKNEAVYEENIEFLNYDVQVKDIYIKDLKNQLEEALKEKDDLKLKLKKFEESSKNLAKLLNSQISAKDKTGLGYDGQMNEIELNNIHINESEVVHSVFNSRESDVDDNLINDRFKIYKGFHAVPPPYTGNYMPLRPDLSFAGLDESVFKSAMRKTTTSVPETKTSISKTSKDIVEKPKIVRPSTPIIEEWDTDNDIATKSGQVPVNAAKQSSPKAAASISTARHVNTAAPKPKVNYALPTTYSYFQAHSPVNNATIAGPKVVVSAAKGNGEDVVKSSAC